MRLMAPLSVPQTTFPLCKPIHAYTFRLPVFGIFSSLFPMVVIGRELVQRTCVIHSYLLRQLYLLTSIKLKIGFNLKKCYFNKIILTQIKQNIFFDKTLIHLVN